MLACVPARMPVDDIINISISKIVGTVNIHVHVKSLLLENNIDYVI